MKAICNNSVIPLRSRANHSSELLSQVLFGELLEILERKGKAWYKVRCIADNNLGWVSRSQVQLITEEEFKIFKNDFAFALDLVQPVRGHDWHFPVPIGSRLPNFDGIRFRLKEEEFHYSGQAVEAQNLKQNPIELLPKIARKYLNAPQMKGGRSPFGIDSPGLVQLVFEFIGVNLPRYSDLQIEYGQPIDFVEEAQLGDIAFFENKKGRITHCGILLEDNKIIHVDNSVRIDVLDHFGIYNTQTSKYTHQLRLVKRHLEKIPKNTERKVKISEAAQNSSVLFDL